MSSATTHPAAEEFEQGPGLRNRAARLVRAGMEAVLLALVCGSPWALGGAGPVFELVLYAGVAVLLLLWAARLLLEGRLTWAQNGVTLCLAGLFLLGAW